MPNPESAREITRILRPLRDPMTRVLANCLRPERTDFADAWVGLEPTFANRKTVRKWMRAADKPGQEVRYFDDPAMRALQRKVARSIEKKYVGKRRTGIHSYCMFEHVRCKEDLDQWQVPRANAIFSWRDPSLPPLEVKIALDPEVLEFGLKPVPLAWFYDERFVTFLQEFVWEVPLRFGLAPSALHGGAQFSLSAKSFLGGSLLADDIAARLNHPELSTWILDLPNPDSRPFRASLKRFSSFRDVLERYWSGAFHPRAIGELTAENAYLDRGFGPAPIITRGLMHPEKGPIGAPREIFQTNFAFGRTVRLQAQSVHPGYWQSARPDEEGFRPEQIMRYSEGNLNRLQIVGEFHIKSGKVMHREKVPDLNAPLDIAMLAPESSWENRGQMGRTSARDYVEATLLYVHYMKYLQRHPHVRVVSTLLQDQILGDAEATIRRHGGPGVLARLRRKALKINLEASRGQLRTDWIEPETLFWAAWKLLPRGEKAAIAHEVVTGFLEIVDLASSRDPRYETHDDPMEWHRHRVHPEIWKALLDAPARRKPKDAVRRELLKWVENRELYLSRRPVYSPAGLTPPWKTG